MSRERHRVLQLLSNHDWVPSDALSSEFCQYGRIIHQLRGEGFEILNKVIKTRNGGKRGYFKLLTAREAVATRLGRGKPVSRAEIEALEGQPTLFDIEAKERHRE
jgi:hypothetical protein